MTQLQSLLDRVSALPSENEYLDEINAINGGTPATGMNAAVTNTEAGVESEANLISQIATALAGKVSLTPQEVLSDVTSNSRSISFEGLSHEPTIFNVVPTESISLSSSTRYVTSVSLYDDFTSGTYSTTSTNTMTTDGFSYTYSNGTLTINTASTSNGGYFRSGVTYSMVYI